MTVERAAVNELLQGAAGEVTRQHLQEAQLTRDSVRLQAVQPVPAVAPTPAAGDQLSLSPEARNLAASRQAAVSRLEARQQKIEEIKRRLSDGTYTVDPHVLARTMLREGVSDPRPPA